jgi:signal transduction histidine kinase
MNCRISGNSSTPWQRACRPHADLERKVAERTRELEEANLAKTRFLAVASHDLRQPLHALGMFIGQLNTPRDAADLQRIVERAEACIAGMNELFDGLHTH